MGMGGGENVSEGTIKGKRREKERGRVFLILDR